MAMHVATYIDNAERRFLSSLATRSASPAVPLVGQSPRGAFVSRAVRTARLTLTGLAGHAPSQARRPLDVRAPHLAALERVHRRVRA